LTRKGDFATLSAMRRQGCIAFEGACRHILSRGNERRGISHDNDRRISFLSLLTAEKSDVEIFPKTSKLEHNLLVYLS
jgi:hypothetical protein